jgi:Na+/proline symporter
VDLDAVSRGFGVVLGDSGVIYRRGVSGWFPDAGVYGTGASWHCLGHIVLQLAATSSNSFRSFRDGSGCKGPWLDRR